MHFKVAGGKTGGFKLDRPTVGKSISESILLTVSGYVPSRDLIRVRISFPLLTLWKLRSFHTTSQFAPVVPHLMKNLDQAGKNSPPLQNTLVHSEKTVRYCANPYGFFGRTAPVSSLCANQRRRD
jgi:hypothetical protein